jgi:hypothetical protein
MCRFRFVVCFLFFLSRCLFLKIFDQCFLFRFQRWHRRRSDGTGNGGRRISDGDQEGPTEMRKESDVRTGTGSLRILRVVISQRASNTIISPCPRSLALPAASVWIRDPATGIRRLLRLEHVLAMRMKLWRRPTRPYARDWVSIITKARATRVNAVNFSAGDIVTK